jgi:fatty acid desaturase
MSMLEGKDLILATRQYAHEVRWKSWWHVFTTIVVLTGGYFVVFMAEPLWLKALGSVLIALTLGRFFVIYHDYLHHSILQHSKLARGLFAVFGLFMLAPISIWERSHNYHHAHNSKLYTSSIGSFPIVSKEKYLASSWSERTLYMFVRHPITIGFGYIFMFLYGMCIRSIVSSTNRHWDSIVAMVVHFGLGVAIYFAAGFTGLLFGFMLPFFLVLALGSYLFYAQHRRGVGEQQPHEDDPCDALVPRQHRLPPHPPSEPAHPLLPPARGAQGHPRAAARQDHELVALGRGALPAAEGLGLRETAHDRAPRDLRPGASGRLNRTRPRCRSREWSSDLTSGSCCLGRQDTFVPPPKGGT